MMVPLIKREVAAVFGLRPEQLEGPDRHKTVALGRHVGMYLTRRVGRLSLPEVGRAFGNRDHATALAGIRKIERRRPEDPELDGQITAIEERLGTADGSLPLGEMTVYYERTPVEVPPRTRGPLSGPELAVVRQRAFDAAYARAMAARLEVA